MEQIFDDSRRYLLHRRLARRWICDGGVLIATAGDRSTFDFSETVASGAVLQVTFNIREVSKACRFLSNYSVYLWNCEHEGEYLLCGRAEIDRYNFATTIDGGGVRPCRKVHAACYAGHFPQFSLDIYDAATAKPPASRAAVLTRMLLPRGLCAAIYQNPANCAAPCGFKSSPSRASQSLTQDAY